MKRRFQVVVLLLLVVIGTLLWTIGKVRRTAVAAPVQTATTLTIQVQAAPAGAPVAPAAPAAQQPVALAATPVAPAVVTPAVAAEPAAAPAPVDPSHYTAQPGDTVADIAAVLPGGDKKTNRDAVIEANPSLQRNPDRVLAGKTYAVPTPGSEPVAPVAVEAPAADAQPAETVHHLRYNARAGDTVSTLAGALLGSDTKENRDAIIGANASLQSNPDRMITEKTYRIPVTAGQPLAAAQSVAADASPRPTTQPDADAVVQAGSGRELRYTAMPGDTVATLATALLGSDTKENTAAIINNNATLRQNPDRVVAGQTYWIPAPTAPQPN